MQATRAVRHAYRGRPACKTKFVVFRGGDSMATICQRVATKNKAAVWQRASARTTKANPSGRPACKLTHVANRRRSGGPSGMQTGTRRQNVAPRAIRSLATLRAARCPPPVLLRRYVRLKRTNLRVIGLSLNRSQKRSALLSTTPRLRTRSSTNDLAPLRRMWLLSLRHTGAFVGARQEPSCCGFATAGAEIGRPAYIVASRRKRR